MLFRSLRLVLGHPQFELAGVMSDSQPGEAVAKAFPHLAAALGEIVFESQAAITQRIASLPRSAVFSAAPHGVSAALIDTLLQAAEAAGDMAQAQAAYTAMLGFPEMRLAGHKGLMQIALAQGARETALRHAQAAYGEARTARWAWRAILESRLEAADWEGALTLVKSALDRKIVPPIVAERARADAGQFGGLADEDPALAIDAFQDLGQAAGIEGRMHQQPRHQHGETFQIGRAHV